jgi:hypothetical protein
MSGGAGWADSPSGVIYLTNRREFSRYVLSEVDQLASGNRLIRPPPHARPFSFARTFHGLSD